MKEKKYIQAEDKPAIVKGENDEFYFLLPIGTYDVITKSLYDRITTGHLPLGQESWEYNYSSFEEAYNSMGALVCRMNLQDDQRGMLINDHELYHEMIVRFERKDRISKLADDKYIDFFSKPENNYFVWREGGERYTDLVDSFLDDLYDACEVHCADWREMRQKYFNTDERILPDEMIKNLEKFNLDECVEYLWFCCMYKSRYISGVIAAYGKPGLIHPVLIKIKQLLCVEE